MRAAPLLAIAVVGVLAGCYRTRFELSPPTPALPSAEYNNHFHFSLINILEISAPVDLLRACSGGPVAAIEEETGILGGIANAFLSYVIPILHVKNATVMCAFTGAPPPMMGPPGQ